MQLAHEDVRKAPGAQPARARRLNSFVTAATAAVTCYMISGMGSLMQMFGGHRLSRILLCPRCVG